MDDQETPQVPPEETPGETHVPPASGGPPATPPPADAAALAAELEKTRAALKAANAESAARRKKLEGYELVESETARLRAELATVQAQADQAKANAKATAIRYAVEAAAGRLNFQDSSDAITLADLSGLQVADDANGGPIRVTGADEAVRALADKRPYLLKPAGDALGTPRRATAQKPPAEPAKPGAPLVRL
jgi:hypothetical protein